MIAEEIAAYLLSFAGQPDRLAVAVEEQRPYLTRDVLRPIVLAVNEIQVRNPHQALVLLGVAKAVAAGLATAHAQGQVIWLTGNAHMVLNQYPEAIACYQEGEAHYTAMGEEKNVVAMQINQVAAFRNLGDYPAALMLAERARATCLAIGEAAELFLANLETNIGEVYEEMGDLKGALATYERARLLYKKVGAADGVARADTNCAKVLQIMDQFGPAEQLLLAARAFFAEAGMAPDLGRADLSLGRLAYYRGQYQQALSHLETAHGNFAAIPLPIEVACVDVQLSFVYRHLNLIEEMMHLAQQAGRLFQKEKMSREQSQCLVNQAVGYQRLNLLPQAEKRLAQARRLLYQQRAWGALATLDADRAELALAAGRPESARRIGRRLAKQISQEQRPSLAARSQLLLARCALARPGKAGADLAEAERLAGQALLIAQGHYLPILQIQAYYLLGQVAEARGGEQAAQAHYRQAIGLNERLRAYLLHDEFQTGFMDDKLPVYLAYLRLVHRAAWQAWQQKENHALLLHGLGLAQTAPLLHLANFVPSAEPGPGPGRLAELRQTWHWYQRKLDSPEASHTGNEAIQWREKMRQLEQEIGELMRLGRTRKTAASAASPEPKQVEPEVFLAALQDSLKPGEALLHYYIVDNEWHALLVTNSSTHLVAKLTTTPALDRLMRAWRFYLQHSGAAEPGQAEAGARPYLARLYQALAAPIQANLAGCSRLYLVLPPEWHDLPLAALFDGQRYLVEQFELVYLSTAGAKLSLRQESPLRPGGDGSPQALVIGYSDSGRLPHTVHEARLVAAALAGQGTTALRLEEEATPADFRELAAHCHLLHLATHALFRPDNPNFSSIQLAGGRITVADLYEMTLPGRPLVVLSACETGRGRPRGGGLLGMGRGFLAAGAAGLVASLWPVSDAATAELMADFYRARLTGSAEAAEALRVAQLAAVARHQPPCNWSCFIFIGG